VGISGLLATWSGALPIPDEGTGYLAFFLLLGQLPAWVVGIVLVMVVSLSTAAFDSFQSAMISTGSNDLFRNKLNLWIIRSLVVVIIVPVVVVALKSPNILQIFLISDLVSASVVPVLVLGLNDRFYWWRGFEVVVGGLGGFFSVFLFGLVYYKGDATMAGKLMILEGGLYANDWSAFGKLIYVQFSLCGYAIYTNFILGAFVAAPIGGLLWGFGALGIRLGIQYVMARVAGRRFDSLDRPAPRMVPEDDEYENAPLEHPGEVTKNGKFF